MSEGHDHEDLRPRWRELRLQQRPEDPKETERLQKELEAKEARERELRERLRKKKDGKPGSKKP